MSPRIGITLGDVTGIGPEVVLKALSGNFGISLDQIALIGDPDHLRKAANRLGLVAHFSSTPQGGPTISLPGGWVSIIANHAPLALDLASGSPAAAQAAVDWLREGAQRCMRRELCALVTGPVSKESIIRSGIPFVGQTEFLSNQAHAVDTAMMLLGHDDRNRWVRVVLATTHVPLRLVSSCLDANKIVRAIKHAVQACLDLGLPRARIGVCGLNPHAGEGGEIGDEEITTIAPAVAKARELGLDVHGPFAADSLFHHAYRGDYDVVVAMYHDQGLAPMKMVAFETGVNWTLGLPFPRTSPDHGTAYNIAGKGIADPSSMVSAIRLAKKLARLTGS